MSASLNWIPCRLLIGLPKAIRSFAYSLAIVGRALGDADRLGGGAEASALERAERNGEPVALLADQVLGRDADVGEGPGRRSATLDPELVLELAGVEAVALFLHDEGADPALLAVGGGEDDVEVGDRRRS